ALVASNVSNVTFRNLAFTGGNTCAYLSGARYLAIDSCVVGPGVSRYALMATNASDHGLMRASRIDRLDPVVHAFQYGGDASGGNGQDCIAFQAASDWEITGCVIADPGHSGINISGEVGPGRYSCRNFIHHNEFLMRKADYGRAVDLQADAVGYCSDNLIYANYIHNHSVRSQLLGDHNVFCYNIIDTTRHCPYEADAERGGGIGILDYLLCQNNGIYNNVITNCDGPAITLVESESCHDNRIVNNICVNNGLVAGAKPGLQHVEFWSWGLYSQANNEILNNVFYNANDPAPVIYHNGPTGRHISVAALNATASNGDVAAWNMSTNPMLAAGFRPLQASPVVNAGKDVGLSRDFAGDPIGAPPNIGAFEKASGTTTDLSAHPAPKLPASPSLEQNYPNPFNPTTTIGFVLASAGHVALKVFNTLGQEVATLVSQALPAGRYQRSWTAANLPSGLYFYRLQTAASTFTRQMLLVK
ncbi:MAG TPA: T9SS type A sorting domain-containing protein, partial [Bacteroidota bacterium]